MGWELLFRIRGETDKAQLQMALCAGDGVASMAAVPDEERAACSALGACKGALVNEAIY